MRWITSNLPAFFIGAGVGALALLIAAAVLARWTRQRQLNRRSQTGGGGSVESPTRRGDTIGPRDEGPRAT